MNQATTPDALQVERVECIPEDVEPGTLYVSSQLETCTHLCPVCGQEVALPTYAPRGWTLIQNAQGVTLSPSIAHRPCGAHYWIRNSKIVRC